MKNRLLPLLAVLAFLGGCSSSPDDETEAAPKEKQIFPYVQMSPIAPPENLREEKQRPPDPQLNIWRPGYWAYDGCEFSWVAGEIIMRPSPSSSWSPDRWERRNYGWVFVPGYWQ